MVDPKQNLVALFKQSLVLENKQPATVESYSRDAEDFINYLRRQHINLVSAPPESLLWYRDHLFHQQAEAENSVRRKIIGVRQFYRFLARQKIVGDSPFDEMPIPERDETLEKTLSEQEFQTIASLVGGTRLKKSRDTSILNLLSWEGLKANEIISLKWNGFIKGKHSISHLNIPGDRARTISLSSETAASIIEYQNIFDEWKAGLSEARKDSYHWLFVSFKGKDGQVILNRMTRHGLKFMLSELGDRSGIKHLHSESLRHLAIERLLASGKRPEDVMRQLGLKQIGNIAKHLARLRVSNDN